MGWATKKEDPSAAGYEKPEGRMDCANAVGGEGGANGQQRAWGDEWEKGRGPRGGGKCGNGAVGGPAERQRLAPAGHGERKSERRKGWRKSTGGLAARSLF
uniref:Uncharacterized protein n=1 Tax=Globodera rostochiensis TaxID=31243 RepID=A0A914HTC3_GLORO